MEKNQTQISKNLLRSFAVLACTLCALLFIASCEEKNLTGNELYSLAVKNLYPVDYPVADNTEGVSLMSQAADKGHFYARCNMALRKYYGWGSYKNDEPQGLEEFKALFPELEKKAEAGEVAAQYYLGRAYDLGIGISERNGSKAVELYRIAAEQESYYAKYFLAIAGISPYDEDQGLVSKEEGLSLLEELVGDKYAPACTLLGDIYCYGWYDEEKNPEVGLEYYEKGWQYGSISAYFDIASYYRNQENNEGYDLARKYYNIAAEKGHGRSMVGLGYMDKYGLGIEEENWKSAKKWYDKAEKVKSKQVYANLAIIAKGHNPDEMTEKQFLENLRWNLIGADYNDTAALENCSYISEWDFYAPHRNPDYEIEEISEIVSEENLNMALVNIARYHVDNKLPDNPAIGALKLASELEDPDGAYYHAVFYYDRNEEYHDKRLYAKKLIESAKKGSHFGQLETLHQYYGVSQDEFVTDFMRSEELVSEQELETMIRNLEAKGNVHELVVIKAFQAWYDQEPMETVITVAMEAKRSGYEIQAAKLFRTIRKENVWKVNILKRTDWMSENEQKEYTEFLDQYVKYQPRAAVKLDHTNRIRIPAISFKTE